MLSYEEIVSKIIESTKIERSVLEQKIKEKIDEFNNLVSEEGAAYIIAKELGVQLISVDHSKESVEIKNLVGGLKNVSVVGRVVAKYPVSTYQRDGKELKVGSLLLYDGTGYCRVVFWNDFIDIFNKIAEDMIIKVVNAYVKENNDRKELHINFRTKVRLSPEEIDPESIPHSQNIQSRNWISKISELNDGSDARILGMIVQIFKRNAFFLVCPECGKKIYNEEGIFMCKDHGRVKPKKKLVLSYIIDDGFSTIRVTSFGRDAETVIGMSTDEAVKVCDENEDDSYIVDYVKDNVVGKEIIVFGTAKINNFTGDIEIISNKIIDKINFNLELSKISNSI